MTRKVHDQGAAGHGGAQKGGSNTTDRGKRGVKRSVGTEAAGIPVGVTMAGANRNDLLLLEESLTDIVVRRPNRPRPDRRAVSGQRLRLRKHTGNRRAVAPDVAPAHTRRGSQSQAPRCQSPTLGRRTRPLLDQSFPPPARALGKKSTNYEAMVLLACAAIVAAQTGLFG